MESISKVKEENLSWITSNKGKINNLRGHLKDLRQGEFDLLNDALIDEGRLLLGTTEHVDHIFHWHL
jgi:hypothetical protein